jgi:hypothetical protein
MNSPLSQNHYLYTHGNPVMFTDPSGHITMMGLINGMNLRVMSALTNVQTSFITIGAGGSAFGALGKIVERQMATIIRFTSRRLQYKLKILNQQPDTVMFGPGGRRIVDLLVRSNKAIANIEAKYQLPTKAGSALTRLIGQMQTYTANSGQTVLFSFKEPEIRTLIMITKELEAAGVPARSIQFVNGYRGLSQWLSLYFH